MTISLLRQTHRPLLTVQLLKNPIYHLTNIPIVAIITKLYKAVQIYGGIAQLGERLNGIQEVSGSIPLISTKMALCEGAAEALETLSFQSFFLFFWRKS